MITDFYPQFTDKFGKPLAGGRVSFYEPDSFTLTKPVYLDYERTVVGQSIQPLNSAGRFDQGILFPSDGTYNIVVERRQGDGYVIEYSGNDIQFVSISASASVVVGFGTDISALEATGQENELKYIAGYYNSDDNGGGWFRWDATNVDPADGGSIIKPFGIAVGAWVRIINDDHIRPEQWGIIPDEANVYTTAFTLLSVYGTANGKTIHMSKGDYNIGGDITFNCPVIMDEVVEFVGTGTVTFANDLKAVQKEPICGLGVLLNISHTQDEPVEISWWRVSQGLISDSSVEIMQAINNSGSNSIIIRQTYKIAEGEAFTQSGKKLIFVNGANFNINSDFIPADPIFQPHLLEYSSKCITGDYDDARYTLGNGTTYVRPPSSIDMKLFYDDGEVIDTTRYVSFANNSDFIDGDTVLNWGDLKVSFIANASTIRLGHVFNGAEITLESTAVSVRFNDYKSLQDRQIFFGDSYPVVNQEIDPIHFGNFSNIAIVDNAPMLNRALEASLQSRVAVDLHGRTYSITTGLYPTNYTTLEMYDEGRKLVIHNGKIVSRISGGAQIFTIRSHGIIHDVEIETLSGTGQCFYLQVPSNDERAFPNIGLYVRNCRINLSSDVTLLWVGTALVGGVYLSIPAEFDDCRITTNRITSTATPFTTANFGTRLAIRNCYIDRTNPTIEPSEVYAGSYCSFLNNRFIDNFQIKLEAVPMFPIQPNNAVINTNIIGNGFKTDNGITSIIESTDLQLILEGNDAVVKDNYLINKLVPAPLPATEGISDSKLVSSTVANPGSFQTITVQVYAVLTRGVEYILPRNNAKLSPTSTGRLFDADITEITGYSVGGYDAFVRLLSARINWKQYLASGFTQYDITYTFSNDTADVNDTIYAWAKFKFWV